MEFFATALASPLASFSALLVLILVVPRLGKLAHLPDVVLLIAAGALVGPNGFQILARTDTVQLLGQIGIIFIMFVAGLEIDVHQLNQNRGKTLSFGLLTFFIPLAMGIAGGLWLGLAPLPAVLLASMFSSHTLLTYPTVSKLGINKDPSVIVAVGGTIVTNFLAMMVLAVIAALHTRQGDLGSLWTLAGTVALYLAGIALLPLVASRTLKRLSEEPDLQFLLVFALLFLASSLAVPAGLEPVIGAFLAGLLLNQSIPNNSLLMNRIQFIGNGLFIPLFLLDVGFLVDLRQVPVSPRSWILGAFMVGVGSVSKALAAWIGGKQARFSPLQTGLLYGLSVNQAAGTLAAVLVGFKIGLFDQDVVTATIMMIVVTCVVGAYLTNRFSVAVARLGISAAGGSRIQRVMVPLSNPESADAILEVAEALIPKSSAMTVYPTVVVKDEAGNESRILEAESLLAKASARFQHLPYQLQPITGLDADLGHGLLRVARARMADTIFMGWNPHFDLNRKIFGSVLDKVVQNAPQRLAILRPGKTKPAFHKLHLLLPLYSEAHSDLSGILTLLEHLVENRGTSLIFYGHPRTREAMAAFWKKMPKGNLLQWRNVDANNKLHSMLQSFQPSPDDVLSMVTARPGQAPWTPSVARIPFQCVETFTEQTLLIFYPEIRPLTEETGQQETAPSGNEKVVSYPWGWDMLGAIRETLRGAVSWKQTEPLARALLSTLKEDPLLLRPGHYFLHLHTPAVKEFYIRHLHKKDQWWTILLTPETESHENHLQVLSRVVRKIRSGEPPFSATP